MILKIHKIVIAKQRDRNDDPLLLHLEIPPETLIYILVE